MAVLIFKPIEKCNSNCEYCETIPKRQDKTASYELLELLFKKIAEYLKEHPQEELMFTWHGGEVGLLGAEYLERAYEFQNAHCGGYQNRIQHLMQTNMTVMTQAHMDALKLLKIDFIGTSFEPLPNIRGFGKNRDSRKYNQQFFEGARLAEKNGIKWGVIYTTHKKSIGKAMEIFHYLDNMNPGSPPYFHQLRNYRDSLNELSMTGEEYADFLGEIFTYYWKRRNIHGNVRPFSWWIQTVLHDKPASTCEMSGECANRWFYIGPEGEAGHCGISGDYGVFQYGNIYDNSIAEILFHKNRTEIAARKAALMESACKGCRFWGMCHGGCPVGAYMVNHDLNMPAPSCVAFKIFMEKYFEPITGKSVNMPAAKEQGDCC